MRRAEVRTSVSDNGTIDVSWFAVEIFRAEKRLEIVIVSIIIFDGQSISLHRADLVEVELDRVLSRDAHTQILQKTI